MKVKAVILFLLISCLTFAVEAKPSKWEQVADTLVQSFTAIGENERAENEPIIFVNDTYVYVTIPEQSPVTVINILGHPIEEAELEKGTYRLRLPSRGIYIVKTRGKIVRITL